MSANKIISPIRSLEIIARVVEMLAVDGKIGGSAIRAMILREFQIDSTPGQIAGMMHREGLKRGMAYGGNPVFPADMSREDRQTAIRERQRTRERKREHIVTAAERVEVVQAENERAEIAAKQHDIITIVGDRTAAERHRKTNIARLAARFTTAGIQSLPALPSIVSPPIEVEAPVMKVNTPEIPLNRLNPPSRVVTAPAEPSPQAYRPVRKCLWPIGEVGSSDYRSCDEPHTTGRPYCQPHCDIAFVKVSSRRQIVGAAD